ncbi:hypothetical protein AAFC00_000351 [Neodothiora populina]|uniref:Uncharacterized protein n=1 Tax=Neodothiora populina TaxID=2781224 RepID=A0ABR3PCK9_9PEZI
MENRIRDRGLIRSHTNLPKLTTSRRNNYVESGGNNGSTSATTTTRKPTTNKPSNDEDKSDSHHHHHRNIHRRHHRHHHTRDTIQNAVGLQHAFSFDNYNPLRRGNHLHSYNNSGQISQAASDKHNHGHNGQLDPNKHETPTADNAEPQHDAIKPITRIIRPADVVKERARRERRAEAVAEALNALSRDAHTATRKLDDTYYALLERLGTLRSTISSLQELSGQAAEARRDWHREINQANQKVNTKLDSFQGFSAQEKAVEELVLRLEKGKRGAAVLEGRLEDCRGRLEGVQRKEVEGRRIVNKRWRICWLSLSMLVLLIILLVVWRRRQGKSDLLVELVEQGEALREKGAELAIEVGVLDREKYNRTKPGLKLVDPTYEKAHMKEEAKWDRLLDEL